MSSLSLPPAALRTLLDAARRLDGADPNGEAVSLRELHAVKTALTESIRKDPTRVPDTASVIERLRKNHARHLEFEVPEGKHFSPEQALEALRAGIDAAIGQERGTTRSPTTIAQADAVAPVSILPSPDHWADASVYHLVLDRFADGDPSNNHAGHVNYDPKHPDKSHGGDLQGVIDKLDYIQELGHNVVWLGPVTAQFGAMAYHNYHTYDFFKVDPRLGDLADMRRLVDEAHKRGMRIMLDVVWQHTAPLIDYDTPDIHYRDEPRPYSWRADAPKLVPHELAESDSLYHARGAVTDWHHPEQRVKGDFPTRPEEDARFLPALNTADPIVQDAMAASVAYFAKTTGIDSIRLDTAGHFPPHDHAAIADKLRERLTRVGVDNFAIVPEQYHSDWGAQRQYVRSVETPNAPYDWILNFPQYFAFQSAFKSGQGTRTLESMMQEQKKLLRPNETFNFIDNHDRPRFFHDTGGRPLDVRKAELEAALTLLYAWPGVPVVYYGTEQGFEGGNDPANRESLFGQHDPDGEFTGLLSDLNALRAANTELRQGESIPLWSEDGPLFAFARQVDGVATVVVSNTQAASRAAQDIPVGVTVLKPGDVLRDSRHGVEVVVQGTAESP
ncbi:MAG: alpha-amylase family glycosyl hydrolase, partial [Myxococcota bacterium]